MSLNESPLARRRAELRITQEDMAARLHMSRANLSRIENGHMLGVKAALRTAVAEHYDLDPAWVAEHFDARAAGREDHDVQKVHVRKPYRKGSRVSGRKKTPRTRGTRAVPDAA
jgi:transcriptional regulator with XRE-family HTH domain